MKKLKLSLPIIVEGKYDKHRLSSLLDAHIITTDGFGIFREDEKRVLIRRIAANGGVIVMTDSDSAGLVIRNYLRSVLSGYCVRHVYIPQVEGREHRKRVPSKEGLLGVEGIDAETLVRLLEPFASGVYETEPPRQPLTKANFYADGFSGRDDSTNNRKELAAALGLPDNLSANALLEAINMLWMYDEYKSFTEEHNSEES
jgi:ribonuclease M5